MHKDEMQKLLDDQAKTINLLELRLKELQHEKADRDSFLDTLLRYVPAHVYWLDKTGRYLGCNELQAKNYGLNSPNEVIGKRNTDLNSWGASELDQINQTVINSGKTVTKEEHFIAANGPMYTLSHKVPVFNEQQKIIGLVGISFDITARKQAEDLLKAEKENAERENLNKTNFILNMSHDIRTPVSSILSLAQILNQRITNQEVKEIVDMLEESGEAVINLIDNLIKSFRDESLKIKPSEKFNVHKKLNEIASLFNGEITRKNLQLILEISKDLPQEIIGNALAFERIIMNCLSNAVKFTNQGYIKISANCLRCTNERCTLQFSITDTGLGIPKDKQEVIFDKFNRLNAAYEGNHQGSGLGLWIVKELLEVFDGKITIDSKTNEGTTFNIELTFDTASGKPQAASSIDTMTDNKNKVQLNKILLIEDQSIPLFAGKTILFDAFHCPVDTASTVKSAISKLKNNTYELIILDIGLPDGTGDEVARYARLESPLNADAYIVGLSAHYDEKPTPNIEKYFNLIALKPLTYEKCIDLSTQFLGR